MEKKDVKNKSISSKILIGIGVLIALLVTGLFLIGFITCVAQEMREEFNFEPSAIAGGIVIGVLSAIWYYKEETCAEFITICAVFFLGALIGSTLITLIASMLF
ncbi:hypothetical protein ACFL5K_01145 [Gemmatimonadota bacterium]